MIEGKLKISSILIIFIYINGFIYFNAFAETEKNNTIEIKKGVIQSAKSIYKVIEPKSFSYVNEMNDRSHPHSPFSWLFNLFPTDWFDYAVIRDMESRVLTDVKVKLDTGVTVSLPNVLLRFIRSSGEEEIQKIIIDGAPGKEFDNIFRIKGVLNYYDKPMSLSLFSQNKKIDVVIGQIEMMYLSKLKLMADGTYDYKSDDEYVSRYEYGLLSSEQLIEK